MLVRGELYKDENSGLTERKLKVWGRKHLMVCGAEGCCPEARSPKKFSHRSAQASLIICVKMIMILIL